MEIPDQYVEWGGTIVAVVVAWLVRLEARLNARPTRKEHEVNTEKIDGKFDEIKRMLEKQNEASLLHRQLVGDSLADIRTKVAVLRERAGDDPLSETGPHRRRL